jgi:hypothetical protein
MEALLARLPESEGVPLFVFDAGYEIPCNCSGGSRAAERRSSAAARRALLLRRPGGTTPRTGRPRRHGPKLNTKDPKT